MTVTHTELNSDLMKRFLKTLKVSLSEFCITAYSHSIQSHQNTHGLKLCNTLINNKLQRHQAVFHPLFLHQCQIQIFWRNSESKILQQEICLLVSAKHHSV